MNPSDTARLVNLIVSTWPTGVKGYVWSDAIGPLNADHVHAAYLELRATEERPPSVARFLAKYYATRSEQMEFEVPIHCELCDGAGDVPTHDLQYCKASDKYDCGGCAVKPCHCTAGRRREPVHARINQLRTKGRP